RRPTILWRAHRSEGDERTRHANRPRRGLATRGPTRRAANLACRMAGAEAFRPPTAPTHNMRRVPGVPVQSARRRARRRSHDPSDEAKPCHAAVWIDVEAHVGHGTARFRIEDVPGVWLEWRALEQLVPSRRFGIRNGFRAVR